MALPPPPETPDADTAPPPPPDVTGEDVEGVGPVFIPPPLLLLPPEIVVIFCNEFCLEEEAEVPPIVKPPMFELTPS